MNQDSLTLQLETREFKEARCMTCKSDTRLKGIERLMRLGLQGQTKMAEWARVMVKLETGGEYSENLLAPKS